MALPTRHTHLDALRASQLHMASLDFMLSLKPASVTCSPTQKLRYRPILAATHQPLTPAFLLPRQCGLTLNTHLNTRHPQLAVLAWEFVEPRCCGHREVAHWGLTSKGHTFSGCRLLSDLCLHQAMSFRHNPHHHESPTMLDRSSSEITSQK